MDKFCKFYTWSFLHSKFDLRLLIDVLLQMVTTMMMIIMTIKMQIFISQFQVHLEH